MYNHKYRVDTERNEVVFTKEDKEVVSDFQKFCENEVEVIDKPIDTARGGKTHDFPQAPVDTPRGVFSQTKTGTLLAEKMHHERRFHVSKEPNKSLYTKLKKLSMYEMYLQVIRIKLKINNADFYAKSKAEQARILKEVQELDDLDYQLFNAVLDTSAADSCTHFRPCVSKFFADQVASKFPGEPLKVGDVSAGFGDRLTGFLAVEAVKEILLIDPSKNAVKGYATRVDGGRSSENRAGTSMRHGRAGGMCVCRSRRRRTRQCPLALLHSSF